MKNLLQIFALLILTSAPTWAQTTIDADDSNIIYWGRVDHSNPKSPSFAYSGVTIRAQFTGTSISAKLNDLAQHTETKTNYFYSIVDGGAPSKFEALAGSNTYVLATGLSAGSHTLQLVKLTEASVGITHFDGFVLDAGASLEAVSNEPTCSIEFIGNSITCGYGNEVSLATNPATGFHSVNENNYKAWGYVAARSLDMRYRAVSYSGRGMYRNNTGSTNGVMPSIYDRIFPDDGGSPSWNHSAHTPDVIVVNLGTNDFAQDSDTNPLDDNAYKSAYSDFLVELKTLHPDATIICAIGVMMTDFYPAGRQHLTRIRTAVQDVVSDAATAGLADIHFFEMAAQSSPHGEDFHPTEATHATMAASLVTFIEGLDVTCSSGGFSWSVSNWLNNKKAAVALTFDDFTPGHPGIAVPELKARGINGTFFIPSGNGANWSNINTAFQDGNEIANHSATHPDLTTLSAQDLVVQIRNAKNTIEANVTGSKVLTMAYPFGSYNDQVIDSLIATDHIGARGVQPASGNYGYAIASDDDDYFKLLTYGISETTTLGQFSSQLNNIENGGGFLSVMYHSIASSTVIDNSYARIEEAEFTSHLDDLVSRDQDLWICKYQQGIQYHREAADAVLAELSAPFADGDTWKHQLSDGLRDDLFFQELTVNVEMPVEVTNVLSVEQNGAQLTFWIDGSTLSYNAVPDAGEIIVHLSNCNPPAVNFVNGMNLEICVPDSAMLQLTDAAGNSYQWYLDGSTIGEDANELYAKAAGQYTVDIENSGCTARSSVLGLEVTVVSTGNCGEPRADFETNITSPVVSQVVTVTDLSENVESGALREWRFSEAVVLVSSGQTVTSYVGTAPFDIEFLTATETTIELFISGSIEDDSVSKTYTVVDMVGCLLDDHFDNGNEAQFVGGWNTFSFDVSSSALNVTTSAVGANEWHSFTYAFNDGASSMLMDFGQKPRKPVIKFRARCSDTLALTVSLIDESGIVAAGSTLGAKNVFDVTTQNQVFQVDLSELFFNQWDSDDLDSTKIAGIDFRINSGFTSFPITNSFGQLLDAPFEGTLSIDWIGVNDDCEVADVIGGLNGVNEAPSFEVYPNPTTGQFRINSEKHSIESWTLLNTLGSPVLQGTGEEVDASHLSQGMYLLKVNNSTARINIR